MFIKKTSGFSLIEMLMALLVASVLMVALAPVITKKFSESISINNIGKLPINERNKTLNFGQDNCTTIDEANNVCKGEFQVPADFSGTMYVTVLGAGGGRRKCEYRNS